MERKTGLVHESDMAHLGSPAENITAVFEYLSRRYGSVEDYFLSAGLTSDEIDAVGRYSDKYFQQQNPPSGNPGGGSIFYLTDQTDARKVSVSVISAP